MNCGDFPAFRDLPKTHTHKHKGQCHSDGILLSEITKTISRVGTLHINPSQQRRVIIHLSGGKTKCIDTTRNILTHFLGHTSLFYDRGSLGEKQSRSRYRKGQTRLTKVIFPTRSLRGTKLFNCDLQHWHSAQSCLLFVFYIRLSVYRFVKGNVCRTFRTLFCLVNIIRRSF